MYCDIVIFHDRTEAVVEDGVSLTSSLLPDVWETFILLPLF